MSAAAIIALITALAPGAISLVNDIKALLAAHAANLTPTQVAALVTLVAQATETTNANTLQMIAADQAAHPTA